MIEAHRDPQLKERTSANEEHELLSAEYQFFFVLRVRLNAQVNKTNIADASTTAYGRMAASGLETLGMAAQ